MLNIKLAKSKMENEEGMNHLLVRVSPEPASKKSDKPVAIFLVIDRSGSMGEAAERGLSQPRGYHPQQPWNPMQAQPIPPILSGGLPNRMHQILEPAQTKMDFVKSAAERLIDMMKDGDYVGVVSFSNAASVDYPLTFLNADEKDKAKKRVRALSANGGTNVSDGLQFAFDQIPASLKETHHIKLILLSDGEANGGVTDADQLSSIVFGYKKNGVSVSAIGVGLSYNSFFMENVATSGGGMFYHLQTMSQLSDIFKQELEMLASLTTKNARLLLSQPEGVHVSANLNGFKEEKPGVVFLGNVYGEQDLVFELSTTVKSEGTKAFSVRLEYENAEGSKKTVEMKIELPLVDESQMEGVKIDKEVAELAAKLVEAKAKKDAIRSYESGDYQSANASLSMSSSSLRSFSKNYSGALSSSLLEDSLTSLNAVQEKLSSGSSRGLGSSADADFLKQTYSSSYNVTRNKK